MPGGRCSSRNESDSCTCASRSRGSRRGRAGPRSTAGSASALIRAVTRPWNDEGAGGPSSGATRSPRPGRARSSAATAWRQNRAGSLSPASSDSHAAGCRRAGPSPPAGRSCRIRPARRPVSAPAPDPHPDVRPAAAVAPGPAATRACAAWWRAGRHAPAAQRSPPRIPEPSLTCTLCASGSRPGSDVARPAGSRAPAAFRRSPPSPAANKAVRVPGRSGAGGPGGVAEDSTGGTRATSWTGRTTTSRTG